MIFCSSGERSGLETYQQIKEMRVVDKTKNDDDCRMLTSNRFASASLNSVSYIPILWAALALSLSGRRLGSKIFFRGVSADKRSGSIASNR